MWNWGIERWLAIVGTFLGILGLVFSVYTYQMSKEERDLVFRVDPNRSEIISSTRVNTAPIRVLRKDGSPVQNDVHAVQFYLWNDGKRSIKAVDILTPLKVYLPPTATILDYSVLRESRPIVGTHLTEGHKPPLQDLGIEFRILERDDGFVGQIIYEGPREAALGIVGLVEGIPEIRTKPVVHFWDVMVDRWLLLILLFGNSVILARLVRRSWLSGNFKLRWKEFALLGMLLILVVLGIAADFSKVHVKLEADNNRQVPESLRAKDFAPPAQPKITKIG